MVWCMTAAGRLVCVYACIYACACDQPRDKIALLTISRLAILGKFSLRAFSPFFSSGAPDTLTNRQSKPAKSAGPDGGGGGAWALRQGSRAAGHTPGNARGSGTRSLPGRRCRTRRGPRRSLRRPRPDRRRTPPPSHTPRPLWAQSLTHTRAHTHMDTVP